MEEQDKRNEASIKLEKLLKGCLEESKKLGANVFLIGAMPNGIVDKNGKRGQTVVAGMFGRSKQDLFNTVCNSLSKNTQMELFMADAVMAVLEHRVDKNK